MAVKSIIDVDVNDDAFKAFMDMFAKYQAALKKLPGAWDAAGKSIDKSGSVIEDMTADMEQQIKIIGKQITVQERMRREVEKTNRSMTDLGRSTMRVAGGIKDITFSLLKWSTITGAFGLLSGGTGLFGFEALARSASQQRTQSMQLNVSPGQLRAANITYERFGSNAGGQLMSTIADMQGDVTRSWMLQTYLGLNEQDIRNKNPAELLPLAMEAIRSRFLSEPDPALRETMARSTGLTEFGPIPLIRQIGLTPGSELNRLNASFPGRVATIGGSNETNERYQNFLLQLDTAGARLQTTLIDKLTPLAGPLGNVVDAFTNLAASALSSNTFRDGLKSFADWINSFAETLGTEETKTSIASFIEYAGKMAKRMMNAAEAVLSFIEALANAYAWVRRQLGGDAPETYGPPNPYGQDDPRLRQGATPENPTGFRRGGRGGRTGAEGYYGPDQQNKEAGSDSFIDQMTRAESGGNPNARNPLSSATGAHQFTAATWLSVAKRFGGSRIAGLSNDQILALRTDSVFSRQMAEAHAQFDLAPALQNAGVNPSNLALYAGWHFGAAGGAAVMRAAGDMPMSQLLSADAIKSNPYLRSLTAGQWRDRFAGQFGGGGSEGGGRMQSYSIQPGQAVQIMIYDSTGGNIINTSTSLGAPGLPV